jgi:hypothetical protein
MGRGRRLALFGLAAGLGALGAAGLAGAQQGDATGGPIPPPAAAPATAPAPPPENALKGAEAPTASEPASLPAEESAPAASSKPAAARPVTPPLRPRYGIAVLQALDKVTAETIRFEAPIGQPIRYKSLVFTVRACETSASDEDFQDAAAHVEIDSVPIAQQGAAAAPARQLFRGWMFANSPGLNLFQNPAYDAWVIACKTAAPAA